MRKYVTNILKIEHVDVAGVMKFRVELKPYYSFDFSGSSVTFLNTISDIRKAVKHIVFCDGE